MKIHQLAREILPNKRPIYKKSEIPKFTIITPVLNCRIHIEQAIKSVLSQSRIDTEYIIVDGGSTDGTLEIIKKYENRITKLIIESDDGISDAFNKGIKSSAGEIIGIINSDDWLESEALEEAATIFDLQNPDILCGAVRFWEDEKEITVSLPDLGRLDRETSVHHTGVFIKRIAYEKYGLYNCDYKYAMDYDLILRMKMNGASFFAVDKVFANRRLEGISYINRHEALRETRLIRREYFSKLNVWLNYIYVWIKDWMGRFLKKSFLKSLYQSYWKLKNKKLFRTQSR